MNVTVNQIRKEMTTLVQAHDMVNSFFWGDFHRAYNEKTQLYPLVCSYLSDGAVNTNMTQMQLVVIVCDKTFKGLENLNDTESDTVTVARHLYNVIRQSPRWNNLLRVNSATLSKFYENTSDEVAGVILTMNVDIKQSRSLCDLPLDNYDFEGTFIGGGGDCEDVLIVNSDQTFTFSAESGTIVELPDAPVLVTDQDGNPLGSGNVPSVTGGVVDITIEPCPPCENATYVLTLGGNAVDSGEIGSGQTEEIPIDAFIPPCEDATVQINGDQVATVASGGMVNIAVENESGTPLGTFDEETGVWVVPDCEDATAVLRDTDNNILSTTPIASGATENITAPDGTVTVNRDGVFFADVDVTSGGVASVNVPSNCPSLLDVGGMMRSGLNVSFAANDEGDLLPGDNTNDLLTNFNNPFGNNRLLTGISGGYQDESNVYRDASGNTVANRAAAFPNEIIINWSTYRPSTKTVWGIVSNGVTGVTRTPTTIVTELATITNSTFTYGGFTGGWQGATQRMLSLFPMRNNLTNVWGYPPMASAPVSGNNSCWLSTQRTSAWVRFLRNGESVFARLTSGDVLVMAMRRFTYDSNTNTLI